MAVCIPNETPPEGLRPDGRRVARRYVVYLPGYDPDARDRYRRLFVREVLRHLRLRGLGKPAVSRPSVAADGLAQSWTVRMPPGAGGVDAVYDVMLWDDIVARDIARPAVLSIALMLATTLLALLNGSIARFYRLNWKCASVVIYPAVATLLIAAGALLLGLGIHAVLALWLGLPWPAALLAAALGAAGLPLALRRPLAYLHFRHLVNDWVFIWQHANGRRGDYEARLDAFAGHVRARLAELDAEPDGAGPIDEVLLVGHSSGALTAIEVAARLVGGPPLPGGGACLSLVTLGSSLPLVAMQPGAARARARIQALVLSRDLLWVDYFAPQDWLNFPSFDPVAELGLRTPPSGRVNPRVRSARFREIIAPEAYRRIRFKPFRMHFQFLMSNDRPGAYDYFGMVLGPQSLAEWVANDDARLSEPERSSAAPTLRMDGAIEDPA